MPATKIGLLYSVSTGIVLRTINPDDSMGDAHLDWLEQNKPAGTALLQILKSDVGADHANCPNLDFLIPHVQNNHKITLSFGKKMAIVDENNIVVDSVLCCPDLYQQKLTQDANTFNAQKALQKGNLSIPDKVPHQVLDIPHAEIGDSINSTLDDIVETPTRIAKKQAFQAQLAAEEAQAQSIGLSKDNIAS